MIMKKLYRLHTKFTLIVDENIEVDRDKINTKIKDFSAKKGKKAIFDFGEKPELDEYDDRVEKEIEKLGGNSYEDKCIFIQE